MNNTDRLFNEKLAGHELPPRPQAWEKLEGQLSKKNRTILWVRLAAALAVVSLLTFLLINRDTTVQPDLAKIETPKVNDSAKDEIKPAVTEPVVETEKKTIRTPSTKKQSIKTVAPTEEPPVVITEDLNKTETIAYAEPQETLEVVTKMEEPAKKSIVLVYELPTVARKTTPAEPVAETVVVTGDEKQNSFQRILETAKDVKNSDNPWGDLREAKNELFALDFKKDRDKNRNQ